MVIVCNVGGVILAIVLCLLFIVSSIGRGNGRSLSEFYRVRLVGLRLS